MEKSNELGDTIKEGEMVELSLNSMVGLTPPQTMKVKGKDDGWRIYVDYKAINKAIPNIAWGKRTHVVLDVGCGVASFGGFLFERDVLTMSFAPKDEHEAQV